MKYVLAQQVLLKALQGKNFEGMADDKLEEFEARAVSAILFDFGF